MLAACESSPEVKRMRQAAADLTKEADQATRRTLTMQSAMQQENARLADENEGQPLERQLFADLPSDDWNPSHCLKRRSTTNLLVY